MAKPKAGGIKGKSRRTVQIAFRIPKEMGEEIDRRLKRRAKRGYMYQSRHGFVRDRFFDDFQRKSGK